MQIDQVETKIVWLPVVALLGMSMSVMAESNDCSLDQELPDEEFLLFLADAVEVDGELVDAMSLLEKQKGGDSNASAKANVAGGQENE